MKKNIIYKVLMLILVASVVTSFTSCGGDDFENTNPNTPNGNNNTNANTPGSSEEQGVTASAEYIEPCLDFGSSQAHVKEYMSGSAWELSDASNDVVLLYTDNKDNMINYAFIDGLHLVTVTYPNFTEKKASGIEAEIERRYGITMTKTTNPEDSSQYMLSGTATINNRTVAIMMNCYAQGINIIYGLPD